MAWKSAVPFFQVVVYSQPLNSSVWESIRSNYQVFLKDQIGNRIVTNLLEEGVLRLQIRSYEPYASPNELISVIRRAVKKHKMGATGRSSILGGVRTWCVYLLTQECKLSNRDAIRLWNKELGESCGFTYTMVDSANDPQEFSFTSPGEVQFSQD